MRCAFIADALHECSELCVWVMEDKISADDPTRRSVPWEQVEFGRPERSLFKKSTSYFHALLTPWPYLACVYMNLSRGAKLSEKLASYQPDIVILGDSQLGILEPIIRKKCPNARVVLDTHNVDWLLTARVADQARYSLRKLKLSLLALNTKVTETRAVTSCDEVWATSGVDADMFRKMGAKLVFTIPNAINLERYNALPLVGNRAIAFCGLYAYPPNEQAALFLIRLSHKLHSHGCNHTLRLIGRQPTRKMFSEAGQASHIEIVGEVDSVTDEVLKSDIFAAPLFVGSGTKFKIIEALALGRAVITTSIGNEGLGLQSERQIFISEPDDFGDSVKKLLEFGVESQAIADNGRKWVEDNLSPVSIRSNIVGRISTGKGLLV